MKKITLIMLIVFTVTLQAQNKLLSEVKEVYNGSSWEINYGYNYEYDNNNNLITETFLDWKDGVWKIRDKTIYTYNANNKVTETIYQNWNESSNKLENSYKTAYTYTNGRLSEILDSNWNTSSWEFYEKVSIAYNSNNLPEGTLSYYWENSQWELYSRFQATYNSNNKIISNVDQKWENSQWVNNHRNLYTYDSNNKIIIDKYEEWKNANWSEEYRTEYDVDATGNKIRATDFNQTINTYKEEFTYDTSNLMSNFANPFKDKTGVDYLFEDVPHINKVLTSNEFTYTNNSYQNYGRTIYNYNSIIILAKEDIEVPFENIILYPNPTNSILNLQLSDKSSIDKIIITDLTGRKVLEQEKNITAIEVQNLANGMYLLQVFSGDKKWQSKFVKE